MQEHFLASQEFPLVLEGVKFSFNADKVILLLQRLQDETMQQH